MIERVRAVAFAAAIVLAANVVTAPVMARPSQTQPVISARAGPTPSVAERYTLADAYLSPQIETLIVNADMRPAFTEDGKGLIYRSGSAGKSEYRYLDLVTLRSEVIASEPLLASLAVGATGEAADPAKLAIGRPEYDPASGTFRFSHAGRRWQLAGGVLTGIEDGLEGAGPAISPDGRFEIFARNFNLVARDRKTGREVALTRDGTSDQPYGHSIPKLADILEAGSESPDLPVSVRWSPDSRYIATWRLDTREVERLSITQESPPGSRYPRSFRYIYPLAGAEKLPQATRYVVDVERALKRRRAKLVTLQIPSESLLYPADPNVDWVDGKVRAQWTARGYGQLLVYHADPDTGDAQIVAREAVAPLVTVTSSFMMPAPDLGGELNVSERSGWAQLYLVKPNEPGAGMPLTRGEWEVITVDHIDVVGRSILLTGVGREADRNPYFRTLYRVSADAGAASEPQVLTPEPLDHDVTISPDGRWIVDAMSSPTEPTTTVLRSAFDGRVVMTLGKADASALLATGFTPPEPFVGVAADGTTPLYGMIWRPANFDPARTYPVIDQVYTGPTTTKVPVTWSQSITASTGSVAQIGAIIVNIDGRGTSRRGQAFRLPAYQNLGEVGLDDHIAMIRQMAAKYPYLDTSRVGVYGGSAGGYDAARFVLRRSDFFKVAVASSGNHDLRLDKAWWPEVSMGTASPEVWERNSNLSVAANLVGKLLLIHGDIDDNVPVTSSMRLANALIQAGRDVDLVVLPNTTHRVNQPFFWRKLRDYFTRYLLDEMPPALPLPVPVTAAPAAASH